MKSDLRTAFGVLVTCGWLVANAYVLCAIHAYKARPGSGGDAPLHIDATVATATSAAHQLKMFVHPHCPCTRASLAELVRLVQSAGDRVAAEVVVVQPPDAEDGWSDSSVTRSVAEVSGLRITLDLGGREARRFGAETSGHVVAYNSAGELEFSGGITAARGHEGENPAGRSLLRLVLGESQKRSTFPVFGCALFTPNACVANSETCSAREVP